MLSASLFSLHPKHHMLIHDNILTDLGHKVCFTIFGDSCGGAEYVKNGASLIQPTQKKMVFLLEVCLSSESPTPDALMAMV